jgi:exosortase A
MTETASYTDAAAGKAVWTRRLVLCGLLIVSVLLLFRETLYSLVAIWWRSETYAHGFVIAPISLYLIWRQREILASLRPAVDLWALPVLPVLGFIWLLGNITDVLIVQHFVLVAFVPALVWLLLGRQVLRAWIFPLAFLFFAVPFGDSLIPTLIHYTATFTVKALQLTGIPVYWEGNHISLPRGEWSVAAACSGIRYLIASVTTGVLYAYLSYRSLWRRLAFILLAVIFPVIANWMRAYMIVMIGYLSDMKLATGIDHIIYGWIFFGFVMLLLFWIGSFWQEPAGQSARVIHTQAGDSGPGKSRFAAAAALLLLVIWPAWSQHILAREVDSVPAAYLRAPDLPTWHREATPFTDWQPRFIGPSATLRQTYSRAGNPVGMEILYYSAEAQGAELINSQNVRVTEKSADWREIYTRSAAVGLPGLTRVTTSRLNGDSLALLIWQWYYIDGACTDNPYMAKLLEARARLFGRVQPSAALFIYAPIQEDETKARTELRDFLRILLPRMTALWSARP